jgi:hypothetical protein
MLVFTNPYSTLMNRFVVMFILEDTKTARRLSNHYLRFTHCKRTPEITKFTFIAESQLF